MKFLACIALFVATVTAHAADDRSSTPANVMTELSFTAARSHDDPFNDVTLDVTFTDPGGHAKKVPAFWDGGNVWKVRYASAELGKHAFRTECSDAADAGLHNVAGSVEVKPYTGENPLYRHGPARVAPDKRHFQYADGTPFFWLADTWWMGLCHRLHWPDDVKTLAADRKAKNFTVIQIVAGLYPDMHQFDPRGANEAGFPWEKDYARIRPEYFDAADQRLMYLVDQGFTPCIVGAWGYYMDFMGEAKCKQQWRYLIARYGAMPVVWCAAGEANLPWYLAKGFPFDDRKQVTGWTHVMQYIRETDPFRRPLTIHPTGIGRLSARHATDDAGLLDFDLLQTPHAQLDGVAPTVSTVRQSYDDTPVMPVIDGEASYEMLSDSLPTRWTRAMFWLCMTNGAAGHTYGANGIWQVNRPGQPHGPSPHHAPGSVGYGKIPWQEAMKLPGSTQVSLGKKLLESFEWQKFEPHAAWADWAESPAGGEGPAFGDWVWYPGGNAADEAPLGARYFRRTFELPDGFKLKRASLRVTADDRFTAYLNGKGIGSSNDWHRFQQFDAFGPLLRPGRNVLAIRAENVKSDVARNPAGLLVGGLIEFQDGKRLELKSENTWRCNDDEAPGWRDASLDDSAWKLVNVVAKFGEGPWGNIESASTRNPHAKPYATGIPRKVRIVYVLEPGAVRIAQLEQGVHYTASHFDPVTGERKAIGPIAADADGVWRCETPAGVKEDWVLILEAGK